MIKIKHSHGKKETHTDLDGALAALRSAYGDGIVTSDLAHLVSDRALVWSSAADASTTMAGSPSRPSQLDR